MHDTVNVVAEYDEFCHPLQRYAATWYSFKLPPSMEGSCHGKFEELSSIIHAEGVRGCCTTSN